MKKVHFESHGEGGGGGRGRGARKDNKVVQLQSKPKSWFLLELKFAKVGKYLNFRTYSWS